MTPTVHARKSKGQFPEAAGESIWSAEGSQGEQEIDATAADPQSNRLPRVMFPDWSWIDCGLGLLGDKPRLGLDRGLLAGVDYPRTRSGRG